MRSHWPNEGEGIIYEEMLARVAHMETQLVNAKTESEKKSLTQSIAELKEMVRQFEASRT